MGFDQVKIIKEEKSESGIFLILQTPNLFYVKINNPIEDTKKIEIFKGTKKIEDFYFQPLIESILDRQNVESYDLEITFIDKLNSLSLLELFIYIINRTYNIPCVLEEYEDSIKLSLMGIVIYNTNMIYREIIN